MTAAPLIQSTRDRLRTQVKLERELATRVIAAQSRLSSAVEKRDAAVAEQQAVVDRHRDAVADALIQYVEQARVGIERISIVLGAPRPELARLIRERRSAMRRPAPDIS
jgi:hypothetical protein